MLVPTCPEAIYKWLFPTLFISVVLSCLPKVSEEYILLYQPYIL